MATNRITPLQFKNYKPLASEQLVPDGGNLYVRVRSVKDGGSISFRFFYRLDKKQKWLTLEAATLSAARKERDVVAGLLKQGIDPSLERKLIVERKRQAQLAEQAAIASLAALITVNALFDRWLAIALKDRQDLKEVRRLFEKDVLPFIGTMTARDVKKGHVVDLVDALILRDAKHTARNMLKLIRQMFRFAVDRDIIEADPTATLSIVKLTVAPTERDRTLSDAEIRALARQLPDANLMTSTECAVWIALSTACRIGELSKAKRSDIDFDLKIWTIPAENAKTKAHTVYLSDFALEQFKRLLAICSSDTWFFPNRNDSSHVCEKSITKQLTGRQSAAVFSNRSKDNQALVLTGGKWTPHDLRRTGATMMGDLGIAPDVIEKCLNHEEENKIKRIYQRQALKSEQAEAWQALGERIALLLNMDGSNVVLMHERG